MKPVAASPTDFKDPLEIINDSIAMFERLQSRLGDQLDRATSVITDLQKLCAERGEPTDALDAAVRTSNSLRVFKTKLDRYMKEITNEQNPIEQRVAIVSVMVELSESIDKQ